MKTKSKSGSTHSDTHRKRSIKDLLIIEKNYADMMDNISDGVYVLNTDGYFIYVNNVILKRSGISQDQFYTLHFLDIVDPEFHEQVKRNFQRVMQGEAGIPYELRYTSSNGQIKTVEVHSRPLYEGKEIVGLQGVSRDITDRKRAEEALKVSEKQFRSLIETIPIGIFTYEGSKFCYLNPACERITGYTREELHLKDFWEIVHPDFKETVREYVHKRQRGEPVPEHYELQFIAKSGEVRWAERGAITIERNENPLVLVTVTDITERKYTEEVLRKSEEKYRTLLENASDPILLADEQGNLIEANRKAEVFFGYMREELLQMHYTQVLSMMDRERTMAAFEDLVTHGHGQIMNSSLLRKDGTIFPVDITATAVEYDGRRVFQASFRDISEHKRTEDTLESMVRERTAELSEKNKQLVEEIMERRRADAALRKKEKELMLHAGKLQEMNAALKVLLKQREEDKRELEDKVMANVKELLLPYLEKLKTSRLDAKDKVHVSILEANLNSIISPFTHRLSSKYSGFTPREIQVANLIRQGKSTKDIAEFMGISRSAINLYRNRIRHKLGIITKKINLRSHLMALS